MDKKYPLHDVEDEYGALLAQWRHTGDPLPLIRHLAAEDDPMKVAVYCDLALSQVTDDDARAELLAIREATGAAPEGWGEALERFAADPSVEAWDALLLWVPEEHRYLRERDAYPRLVELGVDPDLVFELATTHGTMGYGIELADTGLASPEVVLERGVGSPVEGMWRALAARSALARGDSSRAVLLANQALSLRRDEMERTLTDIHIHELLGDLDDEHRGAVLLPDGWDPF